MESPLEDGHLSNYSSSSDDEGTGDIDAFLISIESKLRGKFSSLELCKSIQNHKSLSHTSKQQNYSFRKYLRLLAQSFEQMGKPIKLRVLISLLCLDFFALKKKNGSNKVEKAIYDMIELAEDDDDEWVKILAGVIKGTLYFDIAESEQETTSMNCQGKAAKKLLDKTCNSILKDILNHAVVINTLAENLAIEDNDENDENPDQAKETDIKIDRTVADLAPLFAPLRYTLLSPTNLRKFLPESFDNFHFVTNEEADILKVDAREEKIKAEEERKDMEKKLEQEKRLEEMKKKEQSRRVSSQNSRAAPLGRSLTGRGSVGGRSRLIGRGGAIYGRGNMASRGNLGIRAKNSDGSRGASFMRAPSRPTTGKNLLARSNLGRTNRSLQSNASSITTNQRGGRVIKNARSKMKMIDVAEVKGLTEEQKKNEEEEKRNAKRRSIREMSGIKRTKGSWSDNNSGKANGKKPINAKQTSKENEEGSQDSNKKTKTLNNDIIDPTPVNQNNVFDANTSNSNSLMMDQGNFIPEMNTFPMNNNNNIQTNTESQTLSHGQLLHEQSYFNQGQLLHEQYQQNQQSQHQPMQTIVNNYEESQPQQSMQFNNQFLQTQPINTQQEQYLMNDALMHLQPQNYDGNDLNFDQSTVGQPNLLQDDTKSLSMNSMPLQDLSSQARFAPIPPMDPSDPIFAGHNAPTTMAPSNSSWQQLLIKSNKISNEDRVRVEQFFTSQYNPTPDITLYKMKLHEEKKQMSDGSWMKETMYLELDYTTFGFKKLRKNKTYG